jgi:hypothetical protein
LQPIAEWLDRHLPGPLRQAPLPAGLPPPPYPVPQAAEGMAAPRAASPA